MRTALFALLVIVTALAPTAMSSAQVNHGGNVYVPPQANQDPAPNPAAVVNRPIQYLSQDQMDDMWQALDANGPVERHPVNDPNEDEASVGGDNGVAAPHRRRARCFQLSAFEWFLATKRHSEFGGTVCVRR